MPGTMISDRPSRIEYRPVISAARDGVQAGSTRNWVSRSPSLRELVDPRRWRSAQLAAAVRAKVAVADVVGKDEHDVGLHLRGDLSRSGVDQRPAARPHAVRAVPAMSRRRRLRPPSDRPESWLS